MLFRSICYCSISYTRNTLYTANIPTTGNYTMGNGRRRWIHCCAPDSHFITIGDHQFTESLDILIDRKHTVWTNRGADHLLWTQECFGSVEDWISHYTLLDDFKCTTTYDPCKRNINTTPTNNYTLNMRQWLNILMCCYWYITIRHLRPHIE